MGNVFKEREKKKKFLKAEIRSLFCNFVTYMSYFIEIAAKWIMKMCA